MGWMESGLRGCCGWRSRSASSFWPSGGVRAGEPEVSCRWCRSDSWAAGSRFSLSSWNVTFFFPAPPFFPPAGAAFGGCCACWSSTWAFPVMATLPDRVLRVVGTGIDDGRLAGLLVDISATFDAAAAAAAAVLRVVRTGGAERLETAAEPIAVVDVAAFVFTGSCLRPRTGSPTSVGG